MLQGLAGLTGATAFGIPRWALSNTAQKKVVFYFHPDGMDPDRWFPTGNGSNYQLNPMMQPLESVKEHCAFLRGIYYPGGGSSHEAGAEKALTCEEDTSFDIALGEETLVQGTFPYLHVGAFSNHNNNGKWISRLRGAPYLHDDNPRTAYETYFGAAGSSANTGAGASAEQPLLGPKRDQRILEVARQDLISLHNELNDTELIKLQTHLKSLREVQDRVEVDLLTNPVASGGAPVDVAAGCEKPDLDVNGWEINGWPQPYHALNRSETLVPLMEDIVIQALACGKTRVASFSMGHHTFGGVFEGGLHGATGEHHQTSHNTSGPDYLAMKQWDMTQFARFIQKLANTPDAGGGSLLDNTVVYSFSEIGHSGGHGINQIPVVMAGGPLVKNHYHTFGLTNPMQRNEEEVTTQSQVFVAMAQWMGWDISSYGNMGNGSGPAQGLFA